MSPLAPGAASEGSAGLAPGGAGPVRRREERTVALLVLLAVAAMGFIPVSNADTGFHLTTGRWVLEARAIPARNVLSFTEPDHLWVAHEWLAGVLYALAWRVGGPAGLLALKLPLLVATFGCVYAAARRISGSARAAGVATLLAAWACAFRFVERPHLFTNAALAAVAWLAVTWLEVPGRDRGRARALWLSAALLVANYLLHAGAINGVLLLLVMGCGTALEPLRSNLGRRRSLRVLDEDAGSRTPAAGPSLAAALRTGWHDAWPLVTAAAAAIVATGALLLAIHPHGLAPLWVPFELGTDPELLKHVAEYRPPHTFAWQRLLPYWLFLLATVGALVLLVRRLPLAHLFAATAFLALSLRYVRLADGFAVVGAPVLAAGLVALPWRSWFGRRLSRLRAWLFPVVLAALAVAATVHQWQRFTAGPGLNRRVWPADLFAVVRAERIVGPAFLSDGWAGPFLAEFYPRERAFFDPRFEAYSRAFVLEVYRRIRYGLPGWDRLLDRYGVQLVLMKYTSPVEARRQGGRANLRQQLLAHPGWALVAFNDHGEVFVRRDGANAAVARRCEIVGVDPDGGVFLGRPAQAAPSLQAWMARGGTDNQVVVMAAVAVADAGDRAGALRLLEYAARRQPSDPRVVAARRLIGPP